MLPNNANFVLFLGAVLLICVTPGPDMLFIVANGIQRGPRGGVVAALGMASGMLVHTVLVVTGVSVLIASSPLLFAALRLLGAVYLIVLGARALASRAGALKLGVGAEPSLSHVFRRAVLTNLLNPKVAIFFLAFLPQFVPPGVADPKLALLGLGIAFLVVGLLIDSTVGALSGQVRETLARNTSLSTTMNTVSGAVFVLLGVTQLGSMTLEQIHDR